MGFNSYHYRYATGREGDMPVTGFAPRKQALTIYIMPGFNEYTPLLEKLGKHSTGRSCLYVKRLSDIHMPAAHARRPLGPGDQENTSGPTVTSTLDRRSSVASRHSRRPKRLAYTHAPNDDRLSRQL